MSNLSQTPAISQELVPTLVTMYRTNDVINQPSAFRLKHGEHLGTICTCPVDAIEIDGWPVDNVRFEEAHAKEIAIDEYKTRGAQIYADGHDLEVCSNPWIRLGYLVAEENDKASASYTPISEADLKPYAFELEGFAANEEVVYPDILSIDEVINMDLGFEIPF